MNLFRVNVFTDYIGAYGRGILKGVAAFANTQPDWAVAPLPFSTFERPRNLAELTADAVIASDFNDVLADLVRQRGIPGINLSCESVDAGLPNVLSDDEESGRMGARFFIDRGLRHFLYAGWLHDAYAQIRGKGFSEELKSRGFHCTMLHVSKPEFKEQLALLPRPLGVQGSNDAACLQILDACHDLELKIPEQVAIMGVDDDEMVNSIARPRLATIVVPAEKIGYEAASLLHRIVTGKVPGGPMTIMIRPTGVIVRQSADIIAVTDTVVAQAVRFIRDHEALPINVQDVLAHVLLSRRSLERRFLAALGRTPLQEIHRTHIERSKRLLIDTELSIPDVARASGFLDDTRFGTIFKRDAGETPSAYRRRSRLR